MLFDLGQFIAADMLKKGMDFWGGSLMGLETKNGFNFVEAHAFR
ncbi:hypothetical protein EIKCOROL_00532 [Eikenella corrodens ATCC 23834]|uniref:Uncharacterized protein n=1 Tax=Eikenella corrodens ATCC 23834 TaxID=546274 RepID=C0DT55_EIKCO|nr:hypothetical protein EIKCOROL_00532 [Eikenella corrodens ATCC 23834]